MMKILKITDGLRKKFNNYLHAITHGCLHFNSNFFIMQYGIKKINVNWLEIECVEATIYDGLFGVLIIYRKGKKEVYVDEQMTNWKSFFEFITHKLENFDKNKCESFWEKMQNGKIVCWESK